MRRHTLHTLPLLLLTVFSSAAGAQTSDTDLDTAIRGLQSVNSSTFPHPRFVIDASRDPKGILNKARNTDEGRFALGDIARKYLPGGRYSVETLENTYATHLAHFKSGEVDDSWDEISRQVEATAEAAFAYYIHGPANGSAHLTEVTKRLDLLAQPIIDRNCRERPSSETTVNIGATNYYRREYVWYFGLAYDFAQHGLDDAYKRKIAQVIAKCVDFAAPATITSVNRLDVYPNMDANSLGKFAAGMMLVQGDPEFVKTDIKPAFDRLPAITRTYMDRLHMFGGNDGGYGNGSAYFLYDVAPYLPMWDVFERVLRYSPYVKKDFAKFLPNFALFTLPPGSPEGAFGDGAEVERTEERNRFLRAIYSRSASTRVSRWFKNTYLRNFGTYTTPNYGDVARLDFLLSPSEDTVAEAEPTDLLRYWFPSVGIGAMHSSLSRADRTSVLFRSSPFGAENHAHSDQNSFVIYHKGKVFASDSGINSEYNHDHRTKWSKTTKAHNAITYDGGTGQGNDIAAKGRLVRFNPGVPWGQPLVKGSVHYDLVSGDASQAYGVTGTGTLNVKKAERTLVFVRPSTVVVLDQLESDVARKWEYNLHTVVEPKYNSTTKEDEVTVDGIRMCVQVKSHHPISRLTPEDGYPVEPEAGRTIPHEHWWSRYNYAGPSLKGMFVSVYRLDCPALGAQVPSVSITSDANAVVTLSDGTKVVMSNGVVSVQ